MYYSGDFDPEGLWIAQRLAYFYPGNFEFLNMDTECYEKCISDEPISDVRLKQLERITDERLLGAVQMMRREKNLVIRRAFCKETTCQYEGTSL